MTLESERARVQVAIVHYRSGGMLLDLLLDLTAQTGVDLDIHVVESGDDGTVSRAMELYPRLVLHEPGQNVGYAGGNDIVFAAGTPDVPVLVVNPDVRIDDPSMVQKLVRVLDRRPSLAAAAPIIVDGAGVIEYLGSEVDLKRASAIHVSTHVDAWPRGRDSLDVSWLDGACLLFRRTALDTIGGFDDRYFLIVEEVDWCVRARKAGWDLELVGPCVIRHQRSSSFGGSTKSSYYSARNNYLLFKSHSSHPFRWRFHWTKNVLLGACRRTHLRSGASRSALNGALDAVRGRFGPAPEDRPGSTVARARLKGP